MSPGCSYEPLHPTVSITYPLRVANAFGYCSGGPRCSIPTLAAAAFSFSMSGSPGGGKVRSCAGSPAPETKRPKPAGRAGAAGRSVSPPQQGAPPRPGGRPGPPRRRPPRLRDEALEAGGQGDRQGPKRLLPVDGVAVGD